MAGQPGRLALTVMLVALTGCQDAPPPADSVPPLILDFAPCVDSEARGGPAPGLHSAADTTTLLSEFDALEREIRVAAEFEVPALLFELGRRKSPIMLDGSYPDEDDYAASRPEEYSYNSIGDNWLYTGRHFRDLIGNHPESDLVDDAAYGLTLLPLSGECEGWVDCYVARDWDPLAEFLTGYPDSPLVAGAVDRALAAFGRVEAEQDLRVATEFFDPPPFRETLEAVDRVGRRLPPHEQARLLERAAQLWWQFAEYDRARPAYQAALEGADPETGACLASRLASLPGESLTLAPVDVIHPRHVELGWTAPHTDVTAYVVFRSGALVDPGIQVARLSADRTAWIDTETAPGTTYWYRVVAETDDGGVPSNPASAATPSLRPRVRGVSVSTRDEHLHVFGILTNGFPQVIRISPDGVVVDRRDAAFIGFDDGESLFTTYVDEVWLSEDSGLGVLGFSGERGQLPVDLLTAVRQGGEHIADYPRPRRRVPLLVSVDEAANAVWIERGGGFIGTWVSIGCVAALAICWLGQDGVVSLRDQTGEIPITFTFPDYRDLDNWADAIYADPRDGSAWVVFRQGRLVHVGRDGVVLSDLELTPRSDAYTLTTTADLDRDRAIWFTRLGQEHRQQTEYEFELVRIGVDDLSQRVVAALVHGS